MAATSQWITPEFDWNWDALEPARGTWWWERGDALAGFAADQGLAMRGHLLLWDQSTPAWAKAEMAEKRDWRLVERWSQAVLGRYGARACEWDVVNEAIDTEHGEGDLRRTCFQRAFGSDYIARAFRDARALAPGTRLVLNEYGLEYRSRVERDRRDALIRLAERLRAKDVPLDAIGVQAHLDLRKGRLDEAGIVAMLRAFGDLGLAVTITELDVMEADRSLPVATRDRAVADAMTRYLELVLAESNVTGVTCWGVSDRDSWLETQPGAESGKRNRGLLFDAAYRPKPAWRAVRHAMTA